MADGSKGMMVSYAGRKQPLQNLSAGQIAEVNLWQKQMAALGAKEDTEKKKKAAEKRKEEQSGGEGRYKRMQLARTMPKTKVAEVLSVLYDNQDPFLKALTRL